MTESHHVFAPIIERTLVAELERRRELRPHAQLALAPRAALSAIEESYAALRKRYDPDAFMIYGRLAVVAAGEITELLSRAYEQMREAATLQRQAG